MPTVRRVVGCAELRRRSNIMARMGLPLQSLPVLLSRLNRQYEVRVPDDFIFSHYT